MGKNILDFSSSVGTPFRRRNTFIVVPTLPSIINAWEQTFMKTTSPRYLPLPTPSLSICIHQTASSWIWI